MSAYSTNLSYSLRAFLRCQSATTAASAVAAEERSRGPVLRSLRVTAMRDSARCGRVGSRGGANE